MTETPTPETPRRCGTCTACCTLCEVPELNKDHLQLCPHQLYGIGCAIYETRPKPCRVYRCAWLEGYFADEDRPDKSGVVFERCSFSQNAPLVPGPDPDGILVLMGYQYAPATEGATAARRFLGYAEPGLIVQIVDDETGRGPVSGDTHEVRAWVQTLQQMARDGCERGETEDHHPYVATRR